MITHTTFQKMQRLAKLDFDDSEAPLMIDKLNKIITMIDQVADLNCDDVAPLRSVCDQEQRVRVDQVTTHNLTDQLFNSTAKTREAELARSVQCFIVPKVVE